MYIQPIHNEDEARDNSQHFLMAKVKYILDNHSQRLAYQHLTTKEEKINFFLNHFVMSDYAARQLNFLYLNTADRKNIFLEVVDEFIKKIEQ